MKENLQRLSFDEYIGRSFVKIYNVPAKQLLLNGHKLKRPIHFTKSDIENRNPNVPWRLWVTLVERHINRKYFN
jgi:hypothetical protein